MSKRRIQSFTKSISNGELDLAQLQKDFAADRAQWGAAQPAVVKEAAKRGQRVVFTVKSTLWALGLMPSFILSLFPIGSSAFPLRRKKPGHFAERVAAQVRHALRG